MPSKLLRILAPTLLIPFTALGFNSSWYRAEFGSGYTSNLYSDSLFTPDEYATLSLDFERPFGAGWLGHAGCKTSQYHKTADLGQLSLTGGIDYQNSLGNSGVLTFRLDGLNEVYRPAYSLYDRRTLTGDGIYSLSLAGRLDADFLVGGGWVTFPLYDKSHTVNYREINAGFSINYSLPIKLNLNLSAGNELRDYYGLNGGTRTSFGWATLRFSGPIEQDLGGSLTVTIRKQAESDQDQLYTLFDAGINPEELLWEGWRVGGKLTHRALAWESSFEVVVGMSDYVETVDITDLSQRRDRQATVSFNTERYWLELLQGCKFSLLFDYSYEMIFSNVEYYTSKQHTFQAGVSIEPY